MQKIIKIADDSLLYARGEIESLLEIQIRQRKLLGIAFQKVKMRNLSCVPMSC